MSAIILFEEKQVRRAWSETEEKWYFAIVDVVAVLTDSANPQVYWRVMKKRLIEEGSETVTKCNALKMTAADGKQRLTDVADTEQLLRLIQSIPSPKAEPFKRWLARVGYGGGWCCLSALFGALPGFVFGAGRGLKIIANHALTSAATPASPSPCTPTATSTNHTTIDPTHSM